MGNSTSSVIKDFNKLAINAITSNITKCSTNIAADQNINISGSGNNVDGVSQKMDLKVDLSCLQKASNMEKMRQDLANIIKNTAQQQQVALLGALNSSNTSTGTYIKNDIEQNITKETILKMVNNASNKQSVNVTGRNNTASNLKQDMSSVLISKAAQDAINKLDSVQKLKQKIKALAKLKQVDFISEIFSGLSNLFTGPFVVFAIVLVVAGVAFIIIKKSMKVPGHSHHKTGGDIGDGYLGGYCYLGGYEVEL